MESEPLSIRYSNVRKQVPNSVRLIAVSKGQTADSILSLYNLGHRDFGENYVQELLEKERTLRKNAPDLRWHFIGHLQRNKVKDLLPVVASIHTVDSERLAIEIQKQSEKLNRKIAVYVEVNVDSEHSKSGVPVELTSSLVEKMRVMNYLELQGLMCIPSISDPRSAFRRLKELSNQFGNQTLGRLSMGMSGDYPIAIEEGSTDVRIGTLIFGPRKDIR